MKIFVGFIVIMLIGFIVDYIKNRKLDLSISTIVIKIVLSLLGAFALDSMYE